MAIRILDTHGEFNYVHYESSEKIMIEQEKMFKHLKAAGHTTLSEPYQAHAAILLEKDDQVVAGTYMHFNVPGVICITMSYVYDDYRGQGIYKKLHSLIDQLGREKNRMKVYSYIHAENKPMVDSIMHKIGYQIKSYMVMKTIS